VHLRFFDIFFMTMLKRFLIIKTGSTLPELYNNKGDFEDWIKTGLGEICLVQVVNVEKGAVLPPIAQVSGAVVTGSHCMVTEHLPWSETTAGWLAQAVHEGIPVLGICYGHQLLAYALGSDVGDNPRGSEYGTTAIHLLPTAENDPLLGGPTNEFMAQVCHKQTVLRLPPGAILLAKSNKDECQAFVLGKAWGVQFHPEFDAETMRFYIQTYREALQDEGQDAEALISDVRETPIGATVLGKFARLCVSHG
jgi:GMP synthase (glutamine-hydrolysing)